MSVIHDILASAPGVTEWSFLALCLLSFFTSAVSAAFGLGGGAALSAPEQRSALRFMLGMADKPADDEGKALALGYGRYFCRRMADMLRAAEPGGWRGYNSRKGHG